MITSSTSRGSSWGTVPRVWRMQWAARSSGRVMLKEPRKDLASPVRELATITASRMVLECLPVYLMWRAYLPVGSPSGEWRRWDLASGRIWRGGREDPWQREPDVVVSGSL
jgi:hypothetical protein